MSKLRPTTELHETMSGDPDKRRIHFVGGGHHAAMASDRLRGLSGEVVEYKHPLGTARQDAFVLTVGGEALNDVHLMIIEGDTLTAIEQAEAVIAEDLARRHGSR